jgi:hypothetical protein
MTLYHYTCYHRMQKIEAGGGVLMPQPGPIVKILWATDLEVPNREAIGLTGYTHACDRGEFRYRILEERNFDQWVTVRRKLPTSWVEMLESAPGAMPMHWWIGATPTPAILDPPATVV